MLRYAATIIVCSALCGGCAADYYPNHEKQTTAGDVVKDGPDNYGGLNSTYDLRTPITPAANDAAKPAVPAVGTYGGSNTAGGALGSRPNVPSNGTADTGSSAPR